MPPPAIVELSYRPSGSHQAVPSPIFHLITTPHISGTLQVARELKHGYTQIHTSLAMLGIMALGRSSLQEGIALGPRLIGSETYGA